MADTLWLVRSSSTEMSPVRALTPEEASEYQALLAHLREFDRSPSYLQLVGRNEGEYSDDMANWVGSAERLSKDSGYKEWQEIEVNRRLINYLSSVRLLLDHYELRLKRRYGDSSPQALAFKTATSAAYDTHFEYRFLYRLRNFAQHFGAPAGHAHVQSSLPNPDAIHSEYQAALLLDVEDLLQRGGDVWGRHVDEIRQRGPLLDVTPYLRVVSSDLEAIVTATQVAEREPLLKAGRRVAEILRDVTGPGLSPGAALIEREAPYTTFHFAIPPYRVMSWLGIEGFERPL